MIGIWEEGLRERRGGREGNKGVEASGENLGE